MEKMEVRTKETWGRNQTGQHLYSFFPLHYHPGQPLGLVSTMIAPNFPSSQRRNSMNRFGRMAVTFASELRTKPGAHRFNFARPEFGDNFFLYLFGFNKSPKTIIHRSPPEILERRWDTMVDIAKPKALEPKFWKRGTTSQEWRLPVILSKSPGPS